ncbi:metal-dependent hydrolase [Candidatus Uabimicrobium amorphum]|uniref:Metal-dependent hydrolase n=1 Tax=Uabimicrobium amorphum TaxID=2596890 RepID=A0A5S9F6F8_UABAM|nr:metal-dependent hydrolase [Candidatus Uabimicrobium amorphum]BBM87845.1 hypothetical protein UABAM_06260 [Candidatus Uabimicrobium amorphum]
MDIVTHAMLGSIIGLPFVYTSPVIASGFIIGSTLPDIDAFSRVFGKYNFLKFHQTYTHSVPLIAVTACVVSVILSVAFPLLTFLPIGIALGMIFHALLDLTNTYGIKILVPFSQKRIAYEWMFFIDAPTIALCAVYITFIFTKLPDEIARSTSYTFCAIFLVMCILRAYGRKMAQKYAPANTLSLIPSAFIPWIYFGSLQDEKEVTTFKLSLLSKKVYDKKCIKIYDCDFPQIVAHRDFQVMHSLSPLYHVVEVVDNMIICRDLRTRNFNTNFGRLDVVVDQEKNIVKTTLNV